MSKSGKMKTGTTRRQFLAVTGAVTAFSIVPRHVLAKSGQPAPSDKLNIGGVGVGGMQGANNVRNVKPFNEIFVGTKGFLGTSGRGESVRLIPESKMADFTKPPQVIERSPGHFRDWLRACKGGQAACSNFSISGPYTEWMLLGAISWRFPHEKLLWDGKNLRFTNSEKANEFVKPHFRNGWELKDISATLGSSQKATGQVQGAGGF